MEDYILVPGPQLLESMRAVGYSLKTALADIVDNSLSAGAREIDILFDAESSNPYIAILDDGIGMSKEEAVNAMKLAGVPLGNKRNGNDLGRFGLGLKTASLSQCRSLTVISKKRGSKTGLRWDLDYVHETGDWSLQILDDTEMDEVPRFSALESLEHGTLIIWQKLDALERQGESLSKIVDSRMMEVRNHLGLVFHQFIDGFEKRPKTNIRMNRVPIKSSTPFPLYGGKTQSIKPETIEQGIKVQLFTLPVMSKLSTEERLQAQIPGSLRDSQGFYVYRGGRLVIWGTWFKLAKKVELGKLARVKVEIPNSLDELWELDIKKSQAIPPDFVKERLRTLVARMQAPSEKAHVYRGRVTKNNDPITRLWDLIEDRDSFRYQINRDHPLLEGFEGALDEQGLRNLENLILSIESSFPVQDAVNRVAKDGVPEISGDKDQLWLDALAGLWSATASMGQALSEFVDQMTKVEPFNGIRLSKPEIIQYINDPEMRSNVRI